MTSRVCLVEVRVFLFVLLIVLFFFLVVFVSFCRDVKKIVNLGCSIEVLLGGCCE